MIKDQYSNIIVKYQNQTNYLNLQQKVGLKLNDDSRGTYKTNSHIEFKIMMIKWSLFDYGDDDGELFLRNGWPTKDV